MIEITGLLINIMNADMANTFPELIKKRYPFTLQSKGFYVKNNDRVFDFKGRLYAESQDEAYAKIGIKPILSAPAKVFLADADNPIPGFDPDSEDQMIFAPKGETFVLVGSDYYDIDATDSE